MNTHRSGVWSTRPTEIESAMQEVVPDFPPLTTDEVQRAFLGKPYLYWLRDKLVAEEPLTPMDRVYLWLARCRLAEAAGRMGEAVAAVGYAEALLAKIDPSQSASHPPSQDAGQNPTPDHSLTVGCIALHRAMMASRRGEHDDAAKDANLALQLMGDHPDTTHAHAILGVRAIENDRFDEAEQHHLAATVVARKHQYDHGLAVALHNLAHINLWRGRFDLALRYASEANDIQQSLKAILHTYPLHAVQVFQIRNQRAEAWEVYRRLADLAARMSIYDVFVAIFAARLHLDAENFDAAKLEAERAYSLAVRVGIPVSDVMARTVNSRLHRLMGNPAAAIEWARDAITHARRVGYGYMEAHALIEEGAAHRENGNMEAAASCWKEAVRIAEALGARHEQAHALLLLAALYHGHHGAGHDETDVLWQRASQCILEHGYTFLLERERAIAFPLVAAYARQGQSALRQPAELLLGRLVGVAALPLSIHALGEFVVRRGAHPVDRKALQRRRAGELLRFLLIQPNFSAPREAVLEALWPEQPMSKGQDLLHQATSTLRRALEPDLPDKFPSRYLQIESDRIALMLPDGSTVDYLQFMAVMRGAEPTFDEVNQAIALYQGDLFVEDRYADWAELHRGEVADLYHRALLLRARAHLNADNAHAALADCQTILARDACHEEATLIAMHAHIHLANRPAALRLYHKLEQALDRELQLAPREDLMHFAAMLRQRKNKA